MYHALRTGSVTVKEFFDATSIDHMKKENDELVNNEWIRVLLTSLLMPEEEFATITAPEDGATPSKEVAALIPGFNRLEQWLSQYSIDRKKVIPFFCIRLDRFTIQPQ